MSTSATTHTDRSVRKEERGPRPEPLEQRTFVSNQSALEAGPHLNKIFCPCINTAFLLHNRVDLALTTRGDIIQGDLA